MKNFFKKNIFNIFFLIIVVLLPLQTRYFLMIQNINNNFFEYGSISLYAIDLLILVFVIYGIIYSIKNKKILEKKDKIFFLILSLFNLTVFISIFFALDKMVASYNFLKILLLSTFSFLIFINKIDYKWFMNSFIISSTIQGFLSIYQFINQSIVANKFLGISEQLSFNLGTYVIEGGFGRVLKSYGSFSHPNMLGLFLLIGLFFILLKIIKHKKQSELLESSRVDFKMIYLIYVFGINFIGLVFTFSRISILIFIGSFIFFIIYELYSHLKNKNKKLSYNASILISLVFIIFTIMLPYSDLLASRVDSNNRLVLKSNSERISQIKDSVNIIKSKYLMGLGIGNYTINKSNQNKDLNTWEIQPIHNIYLTILVEVGIFGLILFLGLIIFKFFINKDLSIIIPFVFILLFGVVDHFIITLSFGLLIFFLFLGIEKDSKYDTI